MNKKQLQVLALFGWAPAVILLWSFVGTVIGPIIVRVLAALSVGFVVFQGMDVLLGGIESAVFTQLSSGPAQMVGLLGLANVDDGIKMIFSAIGVRFVLGGVAAGSVKKMRFR